METSETFRNEKLKIRKLINFSDTNRDNWKCLFLWFFMLCTWIHTCTYLCCVLKEPLSPQIFLYILYSTVYYKNKLFSEIFYSRKIISKLQSFCLKIVPPGFLAFCFDKEGVQNIHLLKDRRHDISLICNTKRFVFFKVISN